jgi:hypothetical protein
MLWYVQIVVIAELEINREQKVKDRQSKICHTNLQNDNVE